MPNPWVTFVKEWVKENNIPYSQAIKDPRVSEGYKRSKTQTVARNVAQGKLSDIAERAKAMPPKAKAPLPVRQVFNNPDIRNLIFDYKIKPPEVASRKAKKAIAKTDLESIANKAFEQQNRQIAAQESLKETADTQIVTQMRRSGASNEDIYGFDLKFMRAWAKEEILLRYLKRIMNGTFDYGDQEYYFVDGEYDPIDEIEEWDKGVKKLRSLFKRNPYIGNKFKLPISFEDIGIQESTDDENDDEAIYFSFDDDAEKIIRKHVKKVKELYQENSPEGKAEREAEERAEEVQEIRDYAYGQLDNIVRGQKEKERNIQKKRNKAQTQLKNIADMEKRNQLAEYRDKLAAAKPKRDAAQRSLRNYARVQMRNEAQQRADATQPIRDTTQSQLAALAKAQKAKQSRPAPVRRGRKNTGESL